MAEPESFEKEKNLKKKFDKLTEGPMGYVVYAVLGIVIAFLLNQVLAFGLNTDLPVVAVVSGSMDHGTNENGLPCQKQAASYVENFNNWWNLCGSFYLGNNITEEQFLAFPFHDGFKKGDMPIVQESASYNIGDVVVYTVPCQNVPIIHRIVGINQDGSFVTKGDHNSAPIVFQQGGCTEYSISKSDIHGKVIFIIPKLGYFKVVITDVWSYIASGGRT
jgi:hypothetical protein